MTVHVKTCINAIKHERKWTRSTKNEVNEDAHVAERSWTRFLGQSSNLAAFIFQCFFEIRFGRRLKQTQREAKKTALCGLFVSSVACRTVTFHSECFWISSDFGEFSSESSKSDLNVRRVYKKGFYQAKRSCSSLIIGNETCAHRVIEIYM